MRVNRPGLYLTRSGDLAIVTHIQNIRATPLNRNYSCFGVVIEIKKTPWRNSDTAMPMYTVRHERWLKNGRVYIGSDFDGDIVRLLYQKRMSKKDDASTRALKLIIELCSHENYRGNPLSMLVTFLAANGLKLKMEEEK